MRRNPYLLSLLHPEMHLDVGIPDSGMYPTARFPVTWDTTLTTDGSNTGKLGRLISPGGWYQDSNELANVINTWGNPVMWPNNTIFANLSTVAMRVRLVSFSVVLEYIGTSLSDAGQLSVGQVPRMSGSVAGSWPTNGADPEQIVAQLPDSLTVPLRNGMRKLWKPSDPLDYSFVDSGTFGASTSWLASSGGNVSTVGPWGAIAIGISGAAVSTTVLRVRIEANYEYIPANDFYFAIRPEPNGMDPIALAEAENALGNAVLAAPIQGSIWNSATGTVADVASGMFSEIAGRIGGAQGLGRAFGSMAIAGVRSYTSGRTNRSLLTF